MIRPLAGTRIVEVASIGPGPFAAMVLANLGASLVRIERPQQADTLLTRRRPVLALNLKNEADQDLAFRLIVGSDAVLEGFRPGVLERLGLAPARLLASNPRLVIGRMTGWGQHGPLAPMAGHDINYLALTGALAAIGVEERPVVPLNLIGDFGGGGMLLALGVVSALLHAERSGAGSVVDAAMVDGAAQLMAMTYELAASGQWVERREHNLLDGGAPFYALYRTADAGFVAVGALEPAFFANLVERLDLDPGWLARQYDRTGWDELRAAIAGAFSTKTRDEWAEHFGAVDACVVPVLTMSESQTHPHARARKLFRDGRPSPAPRFSDDGSGWDAPEEAASADVGDFLAAAGISHDEVDSMRRRGIIR